MAWPATIDDKLKFERYQNDRLEKSLEYDVSEIDTTQSIDTFVEIMRLQGFHDVSIWRALKEKTHDMEEYMNSICKSKDEWNEDEKI